MPIYIYRCKKCGTVFDFLRTRSSDRPICVRCQSEDLDKQVASFSVRAGTPATVSHGCSTGTCSCSGE